MVPDLVPPRAQRSLTDRLLHEELSNPQHRTNIHFHHTLPYTPGKSFFERPRDSPVQCEPLDPDTHKPISNLALLSRKLRWVTLGGQYDWTKKRYPDGSPPGFPQGIANFIETLFPQMKAQAAIVNLYTPGDVLSVHRDVAEESERGLVSISLGCDALFLIGLEPAAKPKEEISPLVVRLRSGDAVFMTEGSRFAWHAVPKVIPNTCPGFLENWPGDQGGFEHWRGWMKDKRINLNVRQMWDDCLKSNDRFT
jgi:DNA alkylation damage repair protein AlkB